jgi:hypothetical protein
LNFKGDAALKLDDEEEVAAAAAVGVPVPVPAAVMELEGAVDVTPKPEEVLEELAKGFLRRRSAVSCTKRTKLHCW